MYEYMYWPLFYCTQQILSALAEKSRRVRGIAPKMSVALPDPLFCNVGGWYGVSRGETID
jgi:hypothetical protein